MYKRQVYELPAGFWIKGTREVSFMHLIGVYLAILFHLLPPAPPVVVEHSPRPCHTAVGAAVLFRRLKVASAATRSSSCPVNRAGRPERILFGEIIGMAPYAGECSELALRSITISTQYVSKRHGMNTRWVEMVMFPKANFEHNPAYGAIPMIAPNNIRSYLPARFTGQDADLVASEATVELLNNTAASTADGMALD